MACFQDRVRRIGQTAKSVESYWISAFDSDSKLDKLLQTKNNRSRKVLSGNAENDTGLKKLHIYNITSLFPCKFDKLDSLSSNF